VICAKICKNQIFAENRFFFIKKSAPKKLHAHPVLSENKIQKFDYQPNYLNFN